MLKPVFRKIDPDQEEQEITQVDQFSTDEVRLAETLVRESLQNSNDAKLAGSQLVRLRVALKEPDPEQALFWQQLLEPLLPHLDACGITTEGARVGLPKVLVIEDFGTTGLVGDPYRKDDSSFQDFWRRVGRSHKGGDKSGSWGLGKIVFPSSSSIKTFFGLTIRHDDPVRTPLLMGQTVVRHHSIGSTEYSWLGLFSAPESSQFRGPTSDRTFITRFCKAAGFSRNDESGLSICIPFLRDEIALPDLVPYVVRNYFFPILTGRLEVQIGDLTLNGTTLDEHAAHCSDRALEGGHLLRFVRELHAAQTSTPDLCLADSWDKDLVQLGMSPTDLAPLRESFASGKLIHVRVPLAITHRKDGLQRGHYDLFLRNAGEGISGSALFIRGTITVPGEAQYFPSRRAFAALVAPDGVAARFLRDAENPAHTRWNGQAEKLSQNWKGAGPRLAAIRRSLRSLHDLLAQSVERMDPDALRNILSVAGGGQPRKTPTERAPIIAKPAVPSVPPRQQPFRITSVKGGFVVRGGGADSAGSLIVAMAYDIARGDPFRKHSQFDFDLMDPREIKLTSTGANVKPVSSNELLIDVTASDFEVRVDGFDMHRDLRVKAARVRNETNA
ncbi:MAG: hypothetical protein WC809_19615 [Sinimarinibacterium sp.]|jgi:hypothetical protein